MNKLAIITAAIASCSATTIASIAKLNGDGFNLRKSVIETKLENVREPLRIARDSADKLDELMSKIFACSSAPIVVPSVDLPIVERSYTAFIRDLLNTEGLPEARIASLGVYVKANIKNPFVCALLRRDRDSHLATIDTILSDEKKYQQLFNKYTQWEAESRRIAVLAGSEEIADDMYRRDYSMPGTNMAKLTNRLRRIKALEYHKSEIKMLWRYELYEACNKADNVESRKISVPLDPHGTIRKTVHAMVERRRETESIRGFLSEVCEVYTVRSLEFNIMTMIERVFAESTDSLKKSVVEIEENILRESRE